MRRAIIACSHLEFVLLLSAGLLISLLNGTSALADASVSKADAKAASDKAAKAIAVPTHRQATTLQVNTPGKSQAKLSCFCLTGDDKILAGCSDGKGQIRVLDSEGKLIDTWDIPVNPEAVYSRLDGTIFVAGEGKLLKLSASGKVELTKAAPQVAAINEHPEKLREEVIAEVKEQAEQFATQTENYDKMIKQADKQIDSINEQIVALDKDSKSSAESSNTTPAAKKDNAPKQISTNKKVLQQRLAMYTRQKEQYKQIKDQFTKLTGATPSGELTDKEIDERVKSSMEYKLKAASISATNDDVFLATHAAAGYGFEVWRMDDRFENADKIVKDLSGCCGQMDVKANKDGVFVAENSQHRVCRFNRDGKSIAKWGQSARTGLEGFGSCCNPMNVAFGPNDAIYTAEDDTGRIKRYSVDGKLLGLVGAVELKPGCKNCSISVNTDGSHVYMLDITRNLIIRLDARPADEVTADIEKMKVAPSLSESSSSESGASIILDGIQSLFSTK